MYACTYVCISCLDICFSNQKPTSSSQKSPALLIENDTSHCNTLRYTAPRHIALHDIHYINLMHAIKRSDKHTHTHKYVYTCMHAYIARTHAYTHTSITSIHTHIHAIQTHMHAYMQYITHTNVTSHQITYIHALHTCITYKHA